MRLGTFVNFDKSFSLITKNVDNFEVEGITDPNEFLPRHMLFIKNKKYLTQYLESEDALSIGVVIGSQYAETLKNDERDGLKQKAWWIASVLNVEQAISLFSKPFYEKKIGSPNDVIDGRQMGSTSIHPSAWIAQGVFIGERVTIEAHTKIHPGVVIMSGSSIGENVEIFPNVTIYRNVKIGNNVRIHAQTTIGADGFGYNFFNGSHQKIWHMGGVVIEDNVEIGAGTSIDQGTFSPTKIGAGTKIDNHVQVGHNCQIGEGVVLCGKIGIGGSTTIHDYAILGGGANVSNGLTIGKKAQVAAGAGVIGDIDAEKIVGGFPARDIKEWLKGVATLRKISLVKKYDNQNKEKE